MRILQVVPSYYPAVRYGGPIRSVHGLCKSLAALKHEVHVYTTSVDGEEDMPVPVGEPVMMDGVAVHYFRVPALRRLYWSPSMQASLDRFIGGFDVVHLHSVFLWPTWAAARAASRHGVPYLLAPRGSLVRELIERKSRWIKQGWITLIERHSIAHSAGLHVTAPLEEREARKLGLDIPAVYCVPNGLEVPDRWPALAEGPFASIPKPYALFVGRLNWKKGLDRLIRNWKHVDSLSLVIVGNDEAGLRAQLAELARAEGVEARVVFAGAASDEHKWALYTSAELFVLPSYSENFGNVVAEAMAMACPVVVTEAVGLASKVKEAAAGIVVSGDGKSLPEAINAIRRDPAMRAALGQRGRRLVEAELLWPAVARQMEAIYRKISDQPVANYSGTASVS